MDLILFLLSFFLSVEENFVVAIRFSQESLTNIPTLAKEGKIHFQSLTEKANVPQFGPCWKNAISDLKTGCKFLSENVQSELALKFADCFFQMSGQEPLKCETQKNICLKKLSDRAFNAYTEFYTHTQSICYFLQSQVWHEETEKTIDKLSSTTVEVSKKLEDAEKIQEQLLGQQKESLHLQNELVDHSKIVAASLQASKDKINLIMKDFQESAEKQRELLINVFEHLLSFKEFVFDELSWFNSVIFFIGATIISFLFTSVPRTRDARMLLFITFTANFLFERYLTLSSTNVYFLSNLTASVDVLNSWVWLCRKFCSCLSIVILLYFACNYYDYNLLNYKLLLEIKNQNSKILNHFSSQQSSKYNKSGIDTVTHNSFNSKKWTEKEKTWYQGYENLLNPSDTVFSLKNSFASTYRENFEDVDGPVNHDHSVTDVDSLSMTNNAHIVNDELNNVTVTSEKRPNAIKKVYDLRVKRKPLNTNVNL